MLIICAQALANVRSLAWVKNVDLKMTSQKPPALSASDMPGGLGRVRHVIAVSSDCIVLRVVLV